MTFTDAWSLFLAGLLALGLASLLVNLAFSAWASRRATRITADAPMISVLVPARNEAHNIEACLRSLLAQDYPNYEVIALDDDSTDATGTILDRLAQHDARLRVIHNRQPLPPGVNGKSRACQSLAEQARGDWLLFVDADTVHRADSIRAGVERALGLDVALFSAIPQQTMGSWGERLFTPAGFALIYNFVSPWRIYLERALRPFNAAAIGQYLLVRRDAYFVSGGHDAIRDQILDDVAMGKLIKRRGYRIALSNGDWVRCRMYRGFREMAAGFSKNAFSILHGSLAMSAVFVAACIALFLWPPIELIAGALNGAVNWPAVVAIALTTANFALVNRRIGQPWWIGLLYPLQIVIGVGILLNSIRWRYTGRARWKGRTLTGAALR
ncbi:MAG: glycosyl hydrolase [Candidatus Roseilinea sp.]|nr:MAG: glycosyl hydrolase [Candidatus Roseilinea sp.]